MLSFESETIFLPPEYVVFGKVMFSVVSVCPVGDPHVIGHIGTPPTPPHEDLPAAPLDLFVATHLLASDRLAFD